MRTALRGYSSHWRRGMCSTAARPAAAAQPSQASSSPAKQQQAAAKQQHHTAAAQPKQASSTAAASRSSTALTHTLPPSPYPTSQQVNPHGWITSITSSGVQNLKTLSRPLVEVSAVKALQARAEFELTSAKAGEIAPGASVYLLSVRQTADLAWRVGFASEGGGGRRDQGLGDGDHEGRPRELQGECLPAAAAAAQ